MSMFDLQPGNSVGGYTLIARLGGGAMGSVWRVKDDGGNQYAMKILRACIGANQSEKEYAEQERERLRLKREALALQKIHHPGVCSIVDMELDASVAFIVTELIEGKNLREDVAENGPYVADDLERLTHKLIEAVKAVHEAGIIHRDIKPTNVMIAAHGPVLVDFGISMGEGESHVTRTGLVMGTPGFIAPEIIEGKDSDESTDWWSLVAVLAFAATGKPVFGTKPLMAVLERAASGNADLSGLPAKTMDAFRKALDPNREKRCSPAVLERAISEDAINPLAWPDNHPFDRDATRGTMREMWRETTRETISETISETAREEETVVSTIQSGSTTVMEQSSNEINNNKTDEDYDEESYAESDESSDEAADDAADKPYEDLETSKYGYLTRGSWILLLFVLICAAISCLNFLSAVILNIFIMWASSTAGYNISARLRRKELNNGVAPRGDTFMRVAALPWHIIRGLVYTLPRIVLILICAVIGACVYPLLFGSSAEFMAFNIWSIRMIFPTYLPTILSYTSAGYAIGFVIAWIILAVFKGTDMFRIGLGSFLRFR